MVLSIQSVRKLFSNFLNFEKELIFKYVIYLQDSKVVIFFACIHKYAKKLEYAHITLVSFAIGTHRIPVYSNLRNTLIQESTRLKKKGMDTIKNNKYSRKQKANYTKYQFTT